MEIAGSQSVEDFLTRLAPEGTARSGQLARLAADDQCGSLVSQLLERSWTEYWLAEQLIHDILQLPDGELDQETRRAYSELLRASPPALPTTDELRAEFLAAEHEQARCRVLERVLRWDQDGQVFTELVMEMHRGMRKGDGDLVLVRDTYNAQIVRDVVTLCDRGINPSVWQRCQEFLNAELRHEPSDMLGALPAEMFAQVLSHLDVPDQKRVSAASRGLDERVAHNARTKWEIVKYQEFTAQMGGEKARKRRPAVSGSGRDARAAQRMLDQMCRDAMSEDLKQWRTAIDRAKDWALNLKSATGHRKLKDAAIQIKDFLSDLKRHSFQDHHVNGTSQAAVESLKARWRDLAEQLNRVFDSAPTRSLWRPGRVNPGPVTEMQATVDGALTRLRGLQRQYSAAWHHNVRRLGAL